ncbi:hypothetical protein [Paraburkholderia sp. BCC1876]|uniref:hypothetical protein n=1 Tax=Paraburkholderia sp. BCC1876 TaxID=2676303 RepID=UPI0015901FF0|nr:hypothetical protein [Paraburkholderia sp. BCC1876]
MANAILHHPLSTLPVDSALLLVFQCEDPFLMPLNRIEELIREAKPGSELRGYLWGLYDQRRAAVYSGA